MPDGKDLALDELGDYCDVVCGETSGGECDPFDVPEGFCPATIAIHLGKRMGRI